MTTTLSRRALRELREQEQQVSERQSRAATARTAAELLADAGVSATAAPESIAIVESAAPAAVVEVESATVSVTTSPARRGRRASGPVADDDAAAPRVRARSARHTGEIPAVTAPVVLAAGVPAPVVREAAVPEAAVVEAAVVEAAVVEAVAVEAAVAPVLEQEVLEQAVEAETPDVVEYEFASVALTLSKLAVAATAFSADVPPAPPVPSEQVVANQPIATPASQARPEADADTVLLRRVRTRQAHVAPVATLAVVGSELSPVAPVAPAPRQTTPGGLRQWVPRLAVLSALGAATVITPVLAVAQTEPAVISPQLAAESAIDTLGVTPSTLAAAAADLAPADESAPVSADGATADLLAADPLAELRSSVVASRSEERSELPRCGTPDEAAPNGALAALDSTEYVSLSMPVQEGVYRLTSQFGPRWGGTHLGSDFAAPVGTPIHAIADGVVTYAGSGKDGRSSMLIVIEHEVDGKKIESWYVHMYSDGVFVSEGDVVKVGEVIGEVGNNGNSTGPHVHLEIHTGNLSDSSASAVDALDWLRDHDATPVTPSVVCA